jgi:general secretion pathway protein D
MLLAVAFGVCASADAPESPLVDFNFDQADVRIVIQLVGEMTGRRFVLDEQVEGKVTVVAPARIRLNHVFPFLLTILESQGYSVIERGDLLHVVPLPARAMVEGRLLADDADASDAVGLITRVLRVRHISAIELRRTLEPMVRGGAAGGIAVFGPTNHLIITDTADNLRRIEELIAQLDQEGSQSAVEVVTLQHADANELARQLTAALTAAEAAGRRITRHMQQVVDGAGALAGEAMVVAAPHANSLLLVGAPTQLQELRRLVERLDVQTLSGFGRLNVIFLRYLNAEEAAKSLNALLTKSAEEGNRPRLSVEPSLANNALLVDASPPDFELLRVLVEQLDLPPQQVMVEILIAEVTMGKALDLGVEWSTVEQPADGRTTVIGRSRPGQDDTLKSVLDGVFPEGLTVGVARGIFTDSEGRVLPLVPFLLRAMAEDREVRILSNIPLWAQNNMEASVSVVNNIPVLTSTIEGGAGTARDVIQNIERIDVGIQLKVTPYVNPDQEVRMKLNPIIEAIIDDGPDDRRFTPTIARREVDTTVTIPDRATVVISGLMREDRIQTESKVPFLGDIPLIGRLFRRNIDRTERTNLLIFVTPHIVTDLDDARALRDALEAQTTIDHQSGALSLDAPTDSPE